MSREPKQLADTHCQGSRLSFFQRLNGRKETKDREGTQGTDASRAGEKGTKSLKRLELTKGKESTIDLSSFGDHKSEGA